MAEAERLVLAGVECGFPGTPRSTEKLMSGVKQFFRYLHAQRVAWLDEIDSQLIEDFIWSAKYVRGRLIDISSSTAKTRRWCVKYVFQVLCDLGLWMDLRIVGGAISQQVADKCRPLTELEMQAVRVQAYQSLLATRSPLIVALAEAGGDASEIALVERDDIDLGLGTVYFRGSAPRVNRLSAESLQAVAAGLMNRPLVTGARLCCQDDLPVERAAHSVTVGLQRVIREAGLGPRRGVKPSSIRLYTAAKVLKAEGIEAAARFLGNEGLDRTANSLGYRWQVQ